MDGKARESVVSVEAETMQAERRRWVGGRKGVAGDGQDGEGNLLKCLCEPH